MEILDDTKICLLSHSGKPKWNMALIIDITEVQMLRISQVGQHSHSLFKQHDAVFPNSEFDFKPLDAL